MRKQHLVYFAANWQTAPIEALTRNRDRAILIVPSDDKWNDFHMRARFTYFVVNDGISRVSGRPVFLAFIDGDDDPRRELEQKLSRSRRGWLPARAFPQYFVMLPGMSEYRHAVASEGPKTATRMLIAMNDLVALKQGPKIPEWFQKAIHSKAFALSFMRDAETFFAFHNAGPILSGLHFEGLDGISKDLHLEFKLPIFENAHQIAFRFGESKAFARRVAVLIGKNGVGKSQTLFHLSHALLNESPALKDAEGERPQINRLLAITSPGETRNTFPPIRQAQRIVYKRLHLSRSQWGKKESGFGDVLVQLARTPESIKGITRWNLFTDAVSAILPPEALFVKRRRPQGVTDGTSLQSECFPLTDMLYGGEQHRLERWDSIDPRADMCRYINGKVLPLSSGQITFLRFAAQACLHIENGTLMLFDEPETHLHPNLITEFIRLLDRLLEFSGSLAIVATHSAYFVREVPRSQVLILREGEDRTIEIVTPRLRTLGADIGEISQFVFGDALFGRLLELTRIRLGGDPQHAEELLKSLEDDLATEAWMNLHRELPGEQRQ